MNQGGCLFDAVCDTYTLHRAWMEVWGGRTAAARARGAGVDGVTIAEWEVDWAARLRALQANLVRGTYRPSPLLWFDVPRRRPPSVPPARGGEDVIAVYDGAAVFPVPPARGGEERARASGGRLDDAVFPARGRKGEKRRCSQRGPAFRMPAGRNEGERDTRRLGIPTVTDRVAQRAVKNVLEPLWEQVFLSCSHGYRPERGVLTAVYHVLWHQARGLRWVVDADIASCFDRIEHGRLLALLEAMDDARLLALVSGWLRVGASAPGRGVAQGAVLSPLLANVYLHLLDVTLIRAGLALVRYADDLVVMCATLPEARRALALVAETLRELDLELNRDKTRIRAFGPQFTFLGAQFSEA